MKKILMALAITATVYSGAIAQTNAKCGNNEKKVCKPSADKNSVSCYETNYAQNYKVCKGKAGYYVCCHTPEEVTAVAIRTIDNNYDAYDAAFPEENAGAAAPAIAEEHTSAETAATGDHASHVCRKGADGKPTCYKTEYAKNYKVCKGGAGYHICPTQPHE